MELIEKRLDKTLSILENKYKPLKQLLIEGVEDYSNLVDFNSRVKVIMSRYTNSKSIDDKLDALFSLVILSVSSGLIEIPNQSLKLSNLSLKKLNVKTSIDGSNVDTKHFKDETGSIE